MKKIPSISIVLFSLMLISVGIFSGYLIGLKKVNQKPELDGITVEEKDNIKNSNDLDDINSENLANEFELSQIEDNYIGPNTKIVYTIFYLECKHSIEEIEYPKVEMINMTEEQFKEYIKNKFPDWKVISFSHSLINIRVEKPHLCPNHFIIGEEKGKIAIYKIDEDGKKVLDKILDNAPVSLLKEIDQEKLKKGIVVDSLDEVYDILENFIS